MTGQFDPYHTWLGIPPQRQPPNHYDLLGIPLFEEDPTVISHAADQRMGFLRTFQTGAHQAESQRLLNEVAAARVCLLNAEKKAAYDRSLRAELAAAQAAPQSTVLRAPAPKPRPKPVPLRVSAEQSAPAMQAALEAAGASAPAGTGWLLRRRKNSFRILRFSVTVLALAVLAGLVIWFALSAEKLPAGKLANRSETPAPRPAQPEGSAPPPEQAEGPATPGEHPQAPAGLPAEPPATAGPLPAAPKPEQPEGPAMPPEQTEGPAMPPEQSDGSASPPEEPEVPPTPPEQLEGPGPAPQPAEGPTTAPEQPEGSAPTKLAVPSASEQDELRRRLGEIYDFQAQRTNEQKMDLARRLVQLAEGTELKPAERFVVLRSAAEMAVAAGELDWAFARLEEMGERFAFDVLAAQAFFFARRAEQAGDDRAVGELVRASRELADRAVAARRYDLALSVADAVYEASRRLPSKPFREEVYNLRTEMTRLHREWQAAQQARARLEDNPDDAEAHLTLGRAMCFLWDDWQEGLAHLAKGSDQGLAQAAALDLASDAADATQCVKAGDVWWDLAEQTRGEDRTALQRRAAWWYRQAVAGLSGLELVKATERLKKLDEQLAAGRSPAGTSAPAALAKMPELEIIGEPANLGAVVNSSATDECPRLSADGRNLLFASYRRPPGFVWRFSMDLWMCARQRPGQPWSAPVQLPNQFNSPASEGGPFVSADQLAVLFESNRSEGQGGYDIYILTRRTMQAPWAAPVNLGPLVNSSSDDREPFLSLDGRTLLFSSSRGDGHGGYDIWMCTRPSPADVWSKPVNLGPAINSASDEGGPWLSRDGRLLLFHSDRPEGQGSADLYMATRRSPNAPWSEPVNLAALNSTSTDCQPCLSADGTELFFTSTRPGGQGGRDLWVCRVAIK